MADNVVYADKASLFTLKGNIAVEFMDGEVLLGEFVTQDAYNIFVRADNDLLMIPRQQIRFIKGSLGQPVERDTSQASNSFPSAVVTQPLPELAPEATPAEQPVTPVPSPDRNETTPEPSEEDGTVILMPGSRSPAPVESEEEDEEDGTLILEPGADLRSTGFGNDAAFSDFSAVEEEADDEFDMTVVLDDPDANGASALGEEEVTIALDKEEETADTAVLSVTKGPHTGEVFTLNTGITTLGRSSDNVIVLSKDKEISRHHAIFLFEAENFIIQDQNSLNGTFVNEEPISSPHSLRNGDIILVGVSQLKFEQ